MLKKVLLIALVMSLVTAFESNATAGTISGWSYKCCSELTGDVELRGAPNPITKPTVLIATMNLTLESICRNPAGGSNSTQVIHFTRTVQDSVPLVEGEVLDNGRILVHVFVDLDPFEAAVVCTKGGGDWFVQPDSTGVTEATIHQTWYTCTESDSTPCFKADGSLAVNLGRPIDSASLACTLDLQRNADATVVHDQLLACNEI